MLRLVNVNSTNCREILHLHVSGEQVRFVASNETSLQEARASVAANGYAFPFGIYEGETPVGCLMIGYDTDDDWENPPEAATGNYSLWRLMIDERYQRRGYGREALKLALAFVRSFPCGPASYCWLSYLPDNESARRLYHSFGFQETGEMDGEERIAVLKL